MTKLGPQRRLQPITIMGFVLCYDLIHPNTIFNCVPYFAVPHVGNPNDQSPYNHSSEPRGGIRPRIIVFDGRFNVIKPINYIIQIVVAHVSYPLGRFYPRLELQYPAKLAPLRGGAGAPPFEMSLIFRGQPLVDFEGSGFLFFSVFAIQFTKNQIPLPCESECGAPALPVEPQCELDLARVERRRWRSCRCIERVDVRNVKLVEQIESVGASLNL